MYEKTVLDKMKKNKTIEVYSENKMKRKKAHELKLQRVRFRARNKCLSEILDKIEEGYNLEGLRQYCDGSYSANIDKIDNVKEILKNIDMYKSWEDLREEKRILENEKKY
jgi:hypothetical protein